MCWRLPRGIAYELGRCGWLFLRKPYMLGAIFWFFYKLPRMLKKRKLVQARCRVNADYMRQFN